MGYLYLHKVIHHRCERENTGKTLRRVGLRERSLSFETARTEDRDPQAQAQREWCRTQKQSLGLVHTLSSSRAVVIARHPPTNHNHHHPTTFAFALCREHLLHPSLPPPPPLPPQLISTPLNRVLLQHQALTPYTHHTLPPSLTTMPVTFKFVCGADTRRVTTPQLPNFAELNQLVCELYQVSRVVLKYEDCDGDQCTVSTDVELDEAVGHMMQQANAAVLRFHVSPVDSTDLSRSAPATVDATPAAPTPTPAATPAAAATATLPPATSGSTAVIAAAAPGAAPPVDLMALVAEFMTKGHGAKMTHAVAPLLLAQIKEHPEMLNSIGPMLGELLGANSSIAVLAVPFLLEQLIKHPELLRTLGPYVHELLVCMRDAAPNPTLLQKVLPILLEYLIKHTEMLESFGPILLKVSQGADSSEILPPLAALVIQHPDLIVSLGPLVGKLLIAGATAGGGASRNAPGAGTTPSRPSTDLSGLTDLFQALATGFDRPRTAPTPAEPFTAQQPQQPEQPATNNAVAPTERYADEIRRLKDMGFEFPDEVVAEILEQMDGDVARTVDRLIQTSLD